MNMFKFCKIYCNFEEETDFSSLTSVFLVAIKRFNHNEKNEEFKLDMVSAYVIRYTIAVKSVCTFCVQLNYCSVFIWYKRKTNRSTFVR